jgi:hypothetical protein
VTKTKGGTRATETEKQKFRKLREDGLSVERAAGKLGRSARWGYGVMAQDRMEAKRRLTEMPAPKSLAELDGGVKDCLTDFTLFDETFLGYRSLPWAADAAKRVVGYLAGEDRDYLVTNTPPGVGKTTLFTFRIPLWLICGGFGGDPEVGRAVRIMLGHERKTISEHYVMRIRRVFESLRPFSFWDKANKCRRGGELSIVTEFGRFKPERALGEASLWTKNEFTVAQLADIDLSEKEPTVQAASQESGFIGERVDLGVWDDLVTKRNSASAEQAQKTAEFANDEAETRIEPSGLFNLVGQRFGPLDLFRNRLDQVWVDDDGKEHRKYHHIKYPAHFDEFCDGQHRQWDGIHAPGHGCLLDAHRLPWRDLLQKMADPNYKTVYQQEDTDPERVLIQQAWIEGGTDHRGFPAPGCYDNDRGFNEWPANVETVDAVTVDPAAGNWWAIEWWALEPIEMFRFLIWGKRAQLSAGGDEGFLDWNPDLQRHVGLMEETQQRSIELGHPIKLWVVEQVAAFKYLFQNHAYQGWRRKYPDVEVIAHETQRNKTDPDFGLEALLKMPYKTGRKRLPRKHGDLEALTYLRNKVHELTKWPFAATDDTVMADWFFEHHLERIRDLAGGNELEIEGLGPLPEYLQRQQKTYALR